MYSIDTELLFPPKIIPTLKGLRGNYWNNLIDQIVHESKSELYKMAFVLFMVRLNGCKSCSSDSYKAMRGCYRCASLSIKRFPGSDREIMHLFQTALHDSKIYVEGDEKK
jgi:hypothetical protein